MPAKISFDMGLEPAQAWIEMGEWGADTPEAIDLVRLTARVPLAGENRQYQPDRDLWLAREVARLLGGEVIEVYRLPDQVDPPPGTVF